MTIEQILSMIYAGQRPGGRTVNSYGPMQRVGTGVWGQADANAQQKQQTWLKNANPTGLGWGQMGGEAMSKIGNYLGAQRGQGQQPGSPGFGSFAGQTYAEATAGPRGLMIGQRMGHPAPAPVTPPSLWDLWGGANDAEAAKRAAFGQRMGWGNQNQARQALGNMWGNRWQGAT